MKIELQTSVKTEFKEVAEGFNKNLFRYLLPPPALAKLVNYQGQKPSNLVHIRFLLPWPSDWISRIVDENSNEKEYSFTDEGLSLPFGLEKWKLIHRIRKSGTHSSLISDIISFSTANKLFDIILYPFLYLAFLPRKQRYKTYFEKIISQKRQVQ